MRKARMIENTVCLEIVSRLNSDLSITANSAYEVTYA
jgi:hypothetical protein